MNKKELAEKLAGKCDLSKAKAQEIVQELFDTKPGHGIIAIELDAGRDVQILGFGNFGTKRRAARQGRNPATGATITIAAPMRFLNEILGRPSHERPYLILVVGYPAADALVPRIDKKPMEDITTFIE